MKTPLTRPALPDAPPRVLWDAPRVAVFGERAEVFADALAEASGARRLVVELRHAAGWSADGDRLHCHPDALAEALQHARSGAPTVGVGDAFAACVPADLVVWVQGARGAWSLSAALRPVARDAKLILRRPDTSVARALAARWPR